MVGNCAVLLEPFLPQTAAKLAAAFGLTDAHWADAQPDMVQAGTTLGELPILFAKIDDDTVAAQVAKLGQKGATQPERSCLQKTKSPSTTSPNSTCGSARFWNAKRCPKPTTVEVDGRHRPRHTHGGEWHCEHFKPEDVVGRQVTLLVNLAPRKLRGIESQGMVLMASTEDGGLRFVSPDEGVQPGDVIS